MCYINKEASEAVRYDKILNNQKEQRIYSKII